MSFEFLWNTKVLDVKFELPTKKYLETIGTSAFCDNCHTDEKLWLIDGRSQYTPLTHIVGILCTGCIPKWKRKQKDMGNEIHTPDATFNRDYTQVKE